MKSIDDKTIYKDGNDASPEDGDLGRISILRASTNTVWASEMYEKSQFADLLEEAREIVDWCRKEYCEKEDYLNSSTSATIKDLNNTLGNLKYWQHPQPDEDGHQDEEEYEAAIGAHRYLIRNQVTSMMALLIHHGIPIQENPECHFQIFLNENFNIDSIQIQVGSDAVHAPWHNGTVDKCSVFDEDDDIPW